MCFYHLPHFKSHNHGGPVAAASPATQSLISPSLSFLLSSLFHFSLIYSLSLSHITAHSKQNLNHHKATQPLNTPSQSFLSRQHPKLQRHSCKIDRHKVHPPPTPKLPPPIQHLVAPLPNTQLRCGMRIIQHVLVFNSGLGCSNT